MDIGALYKIHKNQMMRYVWSLEFTLSRADVEDIVQTAFLTVIEKKKAPTHEGNLDWWLFSFCKWAWLGFKKIRAKHFRRETEFTDLTELTATAPEDVFATVSAREQLRKVDEALALIPDVQAEAIYRAAVDEESFADISAGMNVPTDTNGALRGRNETTSNRIRMARESIDVYIGESKNCLAAPTSETDEKSGVTRLGDKVIPGDIWTARYTGSGEVRIQKVENGYVYVTNARGTTKSRLINFHAKYLPPKGIK